MVRKNLSEKTMTMERPGGKKGERVTSSKTVSHEDIARRAKEIWQAKGCPPGCDQQNWCEAEAQLKKERGIT